MGDDPVGDICVEFLAVEVLLRAVAGAKVVDEGTGGFSLRDEVGAVLDECAEWRGSEGNY